IFFFLRMFVEKDGPAGKIRLDRFDFNTGSPMVIKIPTSAITNLINNTTGFSGITRQDVALTYLTDKGDLDRAGIQSFIDGPGDNLVIRLSHLSDVVGLKTSDIPLPRLATITTGPQVVRDTTFADIRWETNKQTDSVVEYGTTKTALSDTVRTDADSLGTFLHSVRITGLTKSTRYYYQICSQDQFGRTVSSAVDSFKTKGKGDFNPPVFDTSPRITKVNPTEAKAFFVTDRQATIEIKYGSTKPLTGQFNENTPKRTHNITLGNLTANTKYYAVVSASAGGQTIQSDTLMFTTPSNVDPSPPAFTRQPTVDSYDVSDTTATVSGQADRDVNVAIKYWAKGTTDTVVVYKADESRDLTIELSNLSAETEYNYVMYITDPANDETIASRLGEFKTGTSTRRDFRFRRRPHLAYGSNNRVILTWATNMRSTGVVLFDRVPTGNAFNADDAREIVIDRSRRVHFVTLGSLVPGTRYVFAVFLESRDFQFLDFPEGAAAGKAIAHKPDGTLLITGTVVVPGGSGSFTTNSAPDTQQPVILNGPTAISQTDNTLIVQWETDELAIGQVNFGTNPINLDQSATETEQNTSHQVTLTNLTANTAYSFTVDATDPVGNGPTQSGTSVSSTTAGADATPPAIDANSINAFPSDVQAIIQWNTDEGSDTEVRYGEDAANLSNTTIDNDVAKEHSLTLTGLTAGKLYYYRTISTDPSGNQSSLTTTKSFRTSATANTAQPNITAGPTETVIAQAGPAVTMTIIWTTDVLATSGVDYDTLSNLSTATSVGSQTGSLNHEVVISGLALDTQYHYQVSSANVHDASLTPPEATSSTLNRTTPATVDATAPAAPASVTAVSGDGAVRLRWPASTDTSGIKGYNIKRNDTEIVSNVSDITYLDQTAANGTAVIYNIIAVDNANNKSSDSNPSTSVTPATTQIPTKPTAGTLPDTVSLKPILLLVSNATAVAGEASRATLTYAFEVATDNVFANIVASITGTSEGTSTNPTNWQVVDAGTGNTVLVDGTTYFWRSRANDGEFNGTWSDTTSFVAAAAKSLAVELATLTAISDRGLVVVEWTITRTDPAHAGFHVYRGRTADGEFEQLTEDLLTSVDATYRFVDGDVQVNQQYYYMIEAVNLTGGTERYDPVLLRVNAPATFALKQNAPNPFNPATTIRFELPGPTQVTLIVYNLLGQEVVRLLDHVAYQAGYHQIQWNGRNATGRSTASGIYVYRIAAGDFVQAKKMLLLK
ncbi:MAG: fibronectin type III domain-containing protein, partial [Gemmatimonadota bacterium]|nr:fibronectin type III domain-containing protein [Gemmatimonadota bacterium]